MNQFTFFSLLISAVVIVVCFVVKSRYWIKAHRVGLFRFLKSFFRWYHLYRIYDSASSARQLYMKANNKINLVVWSVLLFNVLGYLLSRVFF